MHNREKEKIIYNLIKIESVLAKLYTRFSTRKNFTAPVKKFWASIAGEEEIHADILDKILQALKDDNINIDIDIRIEDLKKFIFKNK